MDSILIFFAVEIFTDVILGNLNVIANGGNGHKGQDGGDAAKARNSGKSVSQRILKKFEPVTTCYYSHSYNI